MGKIVTYGIGGYDPTEPNDNITEIKEVPDEISVDIIVE